MRLRADYGHYMELVLGVFLQSGQYLQPRHIPGNRTALRAYFPVAAPFAGSVFTVREAGPLKYFLKLPGRGLILPGKKSGRAAGDLKKCPAHEMRIPKNLRIGC
jgi:hypothetical protein